jgi:hypothetical protein
MVVFEDSTAECKRKRKTEYLNSAYNYKVFFRFLGGRVDNIDFVVEFQTQSQG